MTEIPVSIPREPSSFATAMLWIWRFANTALLGALVWILWRYLGELVAIKEALHGLVDYLSVIAERIH